jgi:hypothetical protein
MKPHLNLDAELFLLSNVSATLSVVIARQKLSYCDFSKRIKLYLYTPKLNKFKPAGVI